MNASLIRLDPTLQDATFIVIEALDEGWLRIRFAPEGTGSLSGTAWVPDCALVGEGVDLQLESWAERFLSDEISPLYFRSAGPHILRDAPTMDGAPLDIIEGDYHLEPLEVEGDWMRVTLRQPSDYCVQDSLSRTNTGWIRWRSEGAGPSVWYYTRGC